MANITIHNNGIVKIYNVNDTTVADAKDKLLAKMYWARHKQTLGGYNAWLDLLAMYYSADWSGMIEHIQACKGKGGKTRHDCIEYLKIIIANS